MTTTRSYPRLSIEDFGRSTMDSHDLDPVYDTLNRVGWGFDQLARWMVAYWCLYVPGEACWFSELEGKAFWRALTDAAVNETPCPIGGRWPRAPERRHWRGHNALKSVEALKDRYERPEMMVEYLVSGSGLTYDIVAGRAQEHVAFGPWIGYKVADMVERVLGHRVDFTEANAMYDSPRKAAMEVWRVKLGLPEGAKPRFEAQAVTDVVDHLLTTFGHYEAPGGGRRFGYQEAETVLCKWASHMSGHYPLGNDLHEIRAAAVPWMPVSQAATDFIHCFPPVPQP